MLEEFEHLIEELSFIPSKGGVFEVTIDGELLHSKKATGKHADDEEVLSRLRSQA